jgi:hypothetical protein
MNEEDGHAMLVARCKALKKLACDLISDAAANMGYPLTDKQVEKQLEDAVEHQAPGCSHTVR